MKCDPSDLKGIAGDEECYRSRRRKMVETQILARGIKNPSIISSMLNVPRHLFVKSDYKEQAYFDEPLPLVDSQTISQPYVTALMIELANLNDTSKVLEIGTGSGYAAALLANIVSEIYTVEVRKILYESARELLKQMKFENLSQKNGDGKDGWESHAPYDAIIVSAAARSIPEKLVNQLKIGGKMIIPVGRNDQELVRLVKDKRGFKTEKHGVVKFVPLI